MTERVDPDRPNPDRLNADNLIEIQDLHTHFFTDEGVVKAVEGTSFTVPRGKTLCVVGESGSGKSITARSIMRIVAHPGKIVSGDIWYYRTPTETVNLAKFDPRGEDIRAIRGKEISMIFQEPMTALSPIHTIGNQMMEMVRLHLPVSKQEAFDRSVKMLGRVGIPKPKDRMSAYTFELSGGMRQRVCIAMALVCEPRLLIADEPTTALDVTTQANILDLIYDLQQEMGMSVMFITHDLGVVAEIADSVVVMYLGKAVEKADIDSIFEDPKHPYTQALMRSIPKLDLQERERLEQIRGMVPHPFNRPSGCGFHTRCDQFQRGLCDKVVPELIQLEGGREVSCLLYDETHAKEAVA
ncbi:MAG: ABC transporter ATP-binding protein [Deinococcota bacterium]